MHPRPVSAVILGVLSIFGIICAVLCVLVGMGSLSGATEGVGIIAVGCASGIIARLFQAAARDIDARAEHDQVMAGLNHVGGVLTHMSNQLAVRPQGPPQG